MNRQAVILAAGRGRRLAETSGGLPKCLVPIGGRPLIEHQLHRLEQLGIRSVCVVAGHAADAVRSAVGGRVDVIVNERFAATNSLYSLWMTRHWVDGPIVLLNGDVLAHPDVYHRVLAVNGSALAYDSSSGGEDEHMKVGVAGPFVRALSKTLPPERVAGENVGVLQFDRRAASALLEEADRLVAAGAEQTWAPAAVDRLARRRPVQAVDVCDLPWTEIDFPEDLRHARGRTWPLIESSVPARMRATA